MTKAELLSLSRDELLAQAVVVGVLNVETKSRADLVDAIAERLGLGVVEVPAAEPTPAARPRGLLGRARALIARVIEKGLHMPGAGSVRESTAKEPTARAALPTVTLAKIYVAQGHPARAIEVLRQVLVRNPDDAEATALLATLRPPTVDPVAASAPAPEPGVGEPAPATPVREPSVPPSPLDAEPETAVAAEAGPVVAAEAGPVVAAEAGPVVAAEAGPVVAAEPAALPDVETTVATSHPPEVAVAVLATDKLLDEVAKEGPPSVPPSVVPVEAIVDVTTIPATPLATATEDAAEATEAPVGEIVASADASLDQAPSSLEFARPNAASLNAEATAASAPKAPKENDEAELLPPGPGPQPMLDDRPLPERYDVDEAVLMPVDPTTAYLYWEVRPSTYEGVLATSRAARLVIRLLLSFDGKNARRDIYPDRLFGDVFVDELPDGAEMRALLGYVVNGVFSPLATAPMTSSPPATVATRLADSLATWTRATTALLPPPLPAGIALSIALAHTRDTTLEPQLDVLAGLPELASALGLDSDDPAGGASFEGSSQPYEHEHEGRVWLLGAQNGGHGPLRVGRVRAPGARWVGSSDLAQPLGSSDLAQPLRSSEGSPTLTR
jgi:hypothetical protein